MIPSTWVIYSLLFNTSILLLSLSLSHSHTHTRARSLLYVIIFSCSNTLLIIFSLFMFSNSFLHPLKLNTDVSGLVDRVSIPSRVLPKTQKMVLDASLLNTHHYKVRIKSNGEQSWEGNSPPHLLLTVVAIEQGIFG